MSENQKKALEQQLWNIANTLRGKMNADEFRDYILGFIFYKYLSERIEYFADDILTTDGIKFTDITPQMPQADEILAAIKHEALQSLGYFLHPEELFSQLAKRGTVQLTTPNTDTPTDEANRPSLIIKDLETIFVNIQKSTLGTESQDDFDNLFEDLDLNSTKLGKSLEDRNTLIAKVINHLNEIDFRLNDADSDILGDAYEYLIGQFASGAGKKAGEFYTPQQVSSILAKIVTTGKQRLKSVYDPTCGSGSLLLRVAREVEQISNVAHFYGQELNRTTYNLARMNMILHGVRYDNFDIKQEDTLERPQHRGLEFEAIVANPPFSAQWSANQVFTTDDRFSPYGKLAPSSKADFAFVQHMVHHLAENGTMALVLPHGALFRGAAEQHIRRFLIKDKNYLDTVIGLPANIFYGTSIPTCIMVYKKCREHPNDILFIDASQEFEKVKTQNILRPEHIDKIVQTYRSRSEIEKFSKRATIADIEANDFNLNIPRYVDTFEAEDSIDIHAIAAQLHALDSQLLDTDTTLAAFCQELGIKPPF
jgi:type I restriction enzyme M protein